MEAVQEAGWARPHRLLIRVLFQSSFPAYTVLFHEACCLALLESVLFHRDTVKAVQEGGPDLTDY